MIMYRNAELRRYQYYVNPSWAGALSIFLLSLLNPVSKVVSMPAQACPGRGKLLSVLPSFPNHISDLVH